MQHSYFLIANNVHSLKLLNVYSMQIQANWSRRCQVKNKQSLELFAVELKIYQSVIV